MQITKANGRFILPMKAIDQVWQESSDVSFVFNGAKVPDGARVVVDGLGLASPLFDHLHKEILRRNFVPEYTLNIHQVLKYSQNLKALLQEGACVSVLIYEPVNVAFIDCLQKLKTFLDQINLVLVVRNDWNFKNTFRSFPHFLRKRLFVDFPPRAHWDDELFSTAEKQVLLQEMAEHFNGETPFSYCPGLKFYSYGMELPSEQQVQSSLLTQRLEGEDKISAKKVKARYHKAKLKEGYISLFKYSPSVVFEGHLKILKLPFEVLYQKHFWRLKPSSHSYFWKLKEILNPSTYESFWKLKHALNPKTYEFFWKARYALTPSSHKLYWRVRHFVSTNLWRFSLSQLGWVIFKLSFPLRKIYYFSQYQYEKRVLGLHKSSLKAGQSQ